MNRKNYLYSSGEFAKLTGVNKRTLHYYNEIGLFRPEIIGENGYHYYTCFQFTELELILTLRKIGLSIDEIKDYSSRPSDESFTEMMTKKKKLIDESIEQLLSAQAFLEQKAEIKNRNVFAARNDRTLYAAREKDHLLIPYFGRIRRRRFFHRRGVLSPPEKIISSL